MRWTTEGSVDRGRGSLSHECLPIVDPVMQLQKAQLLAALLQAQPQLLHVAPAVVHRAVAPVPDAASEGRC